MNRGIAKRAMFEDRDDVRYFLARLAHQVRAGRVEVHAYCVMHTHFHILARSPRGDLSEAMRRVENEHSRRFNRRRKRDGTLVRGRYKSKPVRSVSYRRALVLYIDANPVRAGLVRRSIDYAAGSARQYAQPSGPPWLSREWVEQDACRQTGADGFSTATYLAAYGGGSADEIDDLVSARMASTATDDPLDELMDSTPLRARRWMERKARLADGYRPSLPICGRRALEAALAADLGTGGPWVVEDGSRLLRGVEIAGPGLLRDVCGLAWHAIARPQGGSIGKAIRLARTHRRLVASNVDYAERVTAIVRAAVARSVGGVGENVDSGGC